MRSALAWLAFSSDGLLTGTVLAATLALCLAAGPRLRGRFACRLVGHKYRTVGLVTVRGWRPAALVVCDRCGKHWRGVKP